MGDFPNAIYSPRTIENRPGVVYDDNDTKTFFAEDHQQVTGEVVAIENALGVNLANLGLNGWLSLATIPTLQSSDDPVYVLRFAADMTAIIGLGNRIKLTQHGSVKYFIVVKVGAYTGGNTDITVYGGTDYDMENTGTYPVTLPCYSIAKAPFGFPLDIDKWTVETTNTSLDTKASPTQNTWYNLGSHSIVVPIGSWFLGYAVAGNGKITTADLAIKVSLSTSNNSESDSSLTVAALSYSYVTVGNFFQKLKTYTSKTTLYLNIMTTTASLTALYFRNDRQPLRIFAICAYL